MNKFREIIAPAHWASFLLNADYMSISEDDMDEIYKFFEGEGLDVGDCVSCQPVGIMRFEGVLTDCEEYVFSTGDHYEI